MIEVDFHSLKCKSKQLSDRDWHSWQWSAK